MSVTMAYWIPPNLRLVVFYFFNVKVTSIFDNGVIYVVRQSNNAFRSNLKFSHDCAEYSILCSLLLNNWRLKLGFLSFLFELRNGELILFLSSRFLLHFLRVFSFSHCDLFRLRLPWQDPRFFSWIQRLILFTNGSTIKNAFGLTPIFSFGVESFLFEGKVSTANHSQHFISYRVRGWKVVFRSMPVIIYNRTIWSFITDSTNSFGSIKLLMSNPVSSNTCKIKIKNRIGKKYDSTILLLGQHNEPDLHLHSPSP